MSRISYQGILGPGAGERTPAGYARLGSNTITTRRKDARRSVRVELSKTQVLWLTEVEELTGDGIDIDAIVRALIDLGMELDIDWPLVAGGRMLRQQVRDAVLVRRAEAG